ncbi:MAG TPA: tRNA adenosine(34) deaminase TadA [Polyangiales bacterium]|nr:tRNA adenosine(34) deaminase TadA [Polyangiales bacterium]
MQSAAIGDDESFMREALAEAAAAADGGDVPVGCVLVKDGQIIARGHNHRQRRQDPVAHAEVLAIRAAAETLGSFRLIGVTAYVTLEPCVMCAGALVNARVPRVVYGCDDPKAGALWSLYTIGADPRLNHRFEVTRGVLADTCSAQLSAFFAQLRAQKRRDPSDGGSATDD